MDKKNVLLIISDQHRQSAMSFRGNGIVQTPHMDNLFRRGVHFDKALSPAPLCGPARCSLFTSLYPHQARGILEQEDLGARDDLAWGVETDMLLNSTSLREDPLLTKPFKECGYYTGYAGKWHLGNDILPDWFDNSYGCDNKQYTDWLKKQNLPERGWSLNDFEVRSHRQPPMSIPHTKVSPVKGEEYNDAWITDIALNYLKERPKDKPFFIGCGFNGPHPPFMIPEPWYSMYNEEDIEEPENFHPSDGEPDCKETSFYRQLWNDHGNDWKSWKKSMAVYYGFISYIDHQIGRLINELDEQGVLEDTLIIYTSDHGEMLGSHGLWHKMQAYEESLRVPLLFSAPWLAQGQRSETAATLLDIAPTILTQNNFSVPDSYEGTDLSPWLMEKAPENTETYLFSEQKPLGQFHKETDWRMVTDNQLKLIWNRGDKWELYDLEKDLSENINLSGNIEYSQSETRLREKLTIWMQQTDDSLYPECRKALEGKLS